MIIDHWSVQISQWQYRDHLVGQLSTTHKRTNTQPCTQSIGPFPEFAFPWTPRTESIYIIQWGFVHICWISIIYWQKGKGFEPISWNYFPVGNWAILGIAGKFPFPFSVFLSESLKTLLAKLTKVQSVDHFLQLQNNLQGRGLGLRRKLNLKMFSRELKIPGSPGCVSSWYFLFSACMYQRQRRDNSCLRLNKSSVVPLAMFLGRPELDLGAMLLLPAVNLFPNKYSNHWHL